jgi:hypothetical protein
MYQARFANRLSLGGVPRVSLASAFQVRAALSFFMRCADDWLNGIFEVHRLRDGSAGRVFRCLTCSRILSRDALPDP